VRQEMHTKCYRKALVNPDVRRRTIVKLSYKVGHGGVHRAGASGGCGQVTSAVCLLRRKETVALYQLRRVILSNGSQ
jgi:hypothetical protein